MAELVFAFVARRRTVTQEAWDFQGVTGHCYAYRYPYRLSDKGIVSHWKCDDKSHQVSIELLIEGERIGNFDWTLEASPDADHFVSAYHQLPPQVEFLKPGKLTIVLRLDGRPVHQFPFEVFPIELVQKRQKESKP